jgi:hypothetical protein
MVWSRREEDLQRGLVAARKYHAAHGHLDVPKNFVTDDGYSLGLWIIRQRIQRRNRDLSAERVSELDALGMVWDSRDENWRKGLAAARFYRQTHGDLLVPVHFVNEDGFRLGVWIANRRADNRRSALSEGRVAELDALGIIWDVKVDGWQKGLELARAYQAEHGHLNVPAKFISHDGFRLGKWITRQRASRVRDTLLAEQITQLDALGIVWNPRKKVPTTRPHRQESGRGGG